MKDCKRTYTKLILLFALTAMMALSTGCASLHDAAKAGDIAQVRKMIAQGADVNAKDSRGMTPLFEASRTGHVEISKLLIKEKAKLLVERGTNVNTKDAFDWTLLHWAVRYGETEIARLLIKRGADVNAKDDKASITPLHLVSNDSNIETAKLLIDRGADVNAKGAGDFTPLHNAAFAGKTKIARLLLERGADSSARSSGKTPADFAREKGHQNLASMIEKFERERIQQERDRKEQEKAEKLASTIAAAVARAAPQAGVRPKAVSTKFKPMSDVDNPPTRKGRINNKAYAIVIGIEKYREKLPDAMYATRDAQAMELYLTKSMGFPAENVVTLTNDRASKSDLDKYLGRWLQNNVERGGRVFIYFSGHGAPDVKSKEAYLVPYDGDPAFLPETGYPLSKLYDTLGKLPAKEIVVALDSCFSGGGGRSVLARGARPMALSIDAPMLKARNMLVFSASSGSQISSTFEDKGHGLFTYYLLKGLKGSADMDESGSVDAEELYSYISPAVERIARKKYNNEQTPGIFDPSRISDRVVLIGK
jgi:ankyrin repeat protein